MSDPANAPASPERREPVLHGVALGIAYDGTNFHGYAAQRDVRTVHGELLAAVRAMAPDVSELRGLSRTDAGVHARAQIVAFHTEQRIAPRGWVLGLNHHVPDDLAVRSARVVPAEFNPRFCSRGKRYIYTLLLDPLPDPLLARSSWHVHSRFDLELARAELAAAVGRHDFAAFRSASDSRPNTERELTFAGLSERAAGSCKLIDLIFEGPGFMHNMVRILTGTVVDVATARKKPGAMRLALSSKQRGDAGRTAPPQGLVLDHAEVSWPEPMGEVWPSP